MRDMGTEEHSRRVTDLTVRLAKKMEVTEEELESIYRGALLHDIGKISIPERVLLKKGPLTEDEWKIMRTHPATGYEVYHRWSTPDLRWIFLTVTTNAGMTAATLAASKEMRFLCSEDIRSRRYL